MNVVITGHVDHGKSTVLGRLLADAGSLPEGRVEAVRAHCARQGQPFEYAFLLDALKDERAQGITIDAARVFFKSPVREYMFLDAPGHVEFLRSMVTGAARADAALLVIDAREGVRENSTRHGYLLSALGVRQLAVVVNKMDLVDRSQQVFERVSREFAAFLARLEMRATAVIPVSGATGENVVTRARDLAWYSGPTIIEALDRFVEPSALVDAPFRMPVQAVYKFGANGDGRRIVAGTVASGRLAVGDEVVFQPSGKRSRVRTFEAFNDAPHAEIGAGEAVGFTLADELYVTRGEIATKAGEPMPHVAARVEARLFWLGRERLLADRSYLLKLGTARVPARLESVRRVIDASTLSAIPGRAHVERHEVAECTFTLSKPIAFDAAPVAGPTSRFVLVDRYRIAGGGTISGALGDWQSWAREKVLEAEPAAETAAADAAVIWLTGLSGAGKSTIAEALRDRLVANGRRVEYLDGDQLRAAFPGTGFSREERDAHVMRVGYLASRLEHHGVIVICALISPYEAARQAARAQCRRFVEVYVSTPLEECERRDAKGLYRRARRGELAHFTGIDDPYEAPSGPELIVDTRAVSVGEAVDAIMARLGHPS